MVYSIVLIRRIIPTITGRNVSNLFKRHSECYFTPKNKGKCTPNKNGKLSPKGLTAELPTLLVLTYTYFLLCTFPGCVV